MTSHALPTPLALSLAGAIVLALSACNQEREDRPAEGPVTQGEPLSDPPPAAGQEPVTSIIRSDVVADPVVDLPPDPLEVTVGFPEGSTLTATAERQLATVLASPAFAEGWPIVLRGHSDAAGSDAVNLRASQDRAEAVAEWLKARGVAEDRLRIIAFGEQNPIAPNADDEGQPSEAGRARNRRVEISIAPPAGEPTGREAVASQAGTVLESAVERIGGGGN